MPKMIIKFTSFFFVVVPIAAAIGTMVLTQAQNMPPYSSGQGEWHTLHVSIGISAMHMQLLHNNMVVVFDRTDFGPSNLSLPAGRCRYDKTDIALTTDCTAHSVLYDVNTNSYRPLMVQTDTWCSSGSVLPNGTLVQTGGFSDGERVARTFTPCKENMQCDWIEFPSSLLVRRWYATSQLLPDGRIIIVGGRKEFNYEFFPASSSQTFTLDFLRDTTDEYENNLYPFLHLLPDGNLFVFANTRSILLDYKRNVIQKEFPPIPGRESRNYPSSGSSVLLPIDENETDTEAEILICGGAASVAFLRALHGHYKGASGTCGRIKPTDENPIWVMENMPMARVMGDMILLPTNDVIIINGAGSGTAGWDFGRNPVTRPVIYRSYEEHNNRFSVMSPSPRPRMYHSSALLLHDGRVLVGGSNPNRYYNFSGVLYPTDLSLEAYSPPYLSQGYVDIRPRILSPSQVLEYNQFFSITFVVPVYISSNVVSLRLVAPSFTTHSFGMNQRLIVLRVIRILSVNLNTYEISASGPSTAEIAPPGYYMMFVVHAGIPSHAVWARIQ